MNDHHRRLREYFLPKIKEFGAEYQGMDWGSRKSQHIRFGILLQADHWPRGLPGNILDVGCGTGELAGVPIVDSEFYVGIDALPEMVELARERYPEYTFEVSDVLETTEDKVCDWVVASGIFTLANWSLFQATVQRMYALCQKGVAFNCLSTYSDKAKSGKFYANPLQTFEFCRTLTPWVVLRHDYLPHDFTMYLYRNPR